ncbi:MAG: phosphate ABC transporter ATP-binding protein [Actinomycetota bacterium]
MVAIGDEVVLDHVTVDVADGGRITAVQGPSGAGKSTLLRLCNRLVAPTGGEIRFRGERLRDLDPISLRRRVGMVFQRPTLFPGTVRDNLLVADPDASDEAMVDVLDRSRARGELLDRIGDSLSGGEAQRVCLARTLLTRPEVLLMDEPTSALDPTATRGLEELGRALAADDMPILWVTHDLEQSERIADDRIVLVDGRLAQADELGHYLAREEVDHDHDVGGVEDHHHHAGGEPHWIGPEVDDGRG